VEANVKPLVISNESVLSDSGDENVSLNGIHEGIEYQYTVNSPYTKGTGLKKQFFKSLGKIKEVFYLVKRNRSHGIDCAIFYTNGIFFNVLYIRLLSKILNFKLIFVYHEYRSGFESRKLLKYLSLNDKLFDKYFHYFFDAVMPISEFLMDHVKSSSKNKLVFKLPPLMDFNLYKNKKTQMEAYFLYCGAMGHESIIHFILKSFEHATDHLNFKLYLVIRTANKRVSGKNKDWIN